MLSESEVSDEHHCSFRPALQGQRNFYRRPIMDAYFWKAESRVAAQNARSPVWGGDQLERHFRWLSGDCSRQTERLHCKSKPLFRTRWSNSTQWKGPK
jgi:hypothetical protein